MAPKIRVYPNPTTQQLFIHTHKAESLSYKVVSMNGVEVLRGKTDTTNIVDVSNLSIGVYFIVLSSNEVFERMRFVKQ